MHHIIVLIFIIAGSCNTLLIKWANTLTGECSDGIWRYFQHPVVLTFLMFAGEFLCYLFYKTIFFILRRRNDGSEDTNLLTRGDREFKPLNMLLPAFLDAISTILLLTGLYLTYVSSFQMIRSSSIIFVGLLGSIHMNQTLIGRHWSAIVTIICGLTIIISTDMQRVVYDQNSLAHINANAVLSGDLMIICASIFQAGRMVYEEKYLKACSVPILQAIGWQGLFGILITMFLGICMNFLPTPIIPFNDSSRGVFDDLMDVYSQLRSNPWLIVALSLFIVTTLLYGYTSLCIIRFSSSANLVLAESVRSYLVWLAALLLEWEYLNFISIIGFLILQIGLITYRKAILLEWYRSVLLRLSRNRYADMSGDPTAGLGGGTTGDVPTSRPADII
ncbi:solute carrier family 35 member F6 [Calliphora vicina]|uniref:solute carrier family 35 member F6 n=1 Tax=Calliphora vicina TaxID=7373 RepID=UPI00325BF827